MCKVPMYVITCDFGDGDPMYLAWQPYEWADSILEEYFWTSMESLKKILMKNPEFNMPPHQFAFGHEAGALQLSKKLNAVWSKIHGREKSTARNEKIIRFEL